GRSDSASRSGGAESAAPLRDRAVSRDRNGRRRGLAGRADRYGIPQHRGSPGVRVRADAIQYSADCDSGRPPSTLATARVDDGLGHRWLDPDRRRLPRAGEGKRADRPAGGTRARVTVANERAIRQLDRSVEPPRRLLVPVQAAPNRDGAGQVEVSEQIVSLVAPDSFEADQYRTLR